MFHGTVSRRTPQATKDPSAPELNLTLVGAGWSRRLRQSLVIGSDADCDLRIDGADVGGRHAEIHPVGGLWWLRDLGSDDGTFLDGEIVEAEPLGTPCEIRLGVHGPILRLDGRNDSPKARTT